MIKDTRHGDNDRLTITRAEVAKLLGRDISWVRRHQGKELHPSLVDGAHRFDRAEVERLRERLEAERAETRASEALTVTIEAFFAQHLKCPSQVTVDGIVERTGVESRIVLAMHRRWTAERRKGGLAVESLLSRAALRAREQREMDAFDRECDARAATLEREEREEQEEQKLRAAKRKRDEEREEERRAAIAAADDVQRKQRNAEHEARMATLRAQTRDPDLLDRLADVVAATSIEELLRIWRTPRG